MRKIIYLLEFIKNLFKYSKKKFNTDKLQIWVGQTCSLRCKNCSQLFPYIEQKLYDIDEVINELKIALKYINPESIHIIGGEPFTNNNIAKLIEFVCRINPNKPNKIISNGTVIPKDTIIELLAKNNKNIFVTISKYPIVKDRQEKFYKILKEKGVDVRYIQTKDYWYYMGDNKQKEIKNNKILKNNFKLCWDKTCITLAEGVLSICPRMHNSPIIFAKNGEKKIFIEHLPIKKIPDNNIGRALVATCLTQRTYRESCRFCWGMSDTSNIKVEIAEQIERD